MTPFFSPLMIYFLSAFVLVMGGALLPLTVVGVPFTPSMQKADPISGSFINQIVLLTRSKDMTKRRHLLKKMPQLATLSFPSPPPSKSQTSPEGSSLSTTPLLEPTPIAPRVKDGDTWLQSFLRSSFIDGVASYPPMMFYYEYSHWHTVDRVHEQLQANDAAAYRECRLLRWQSTIGHIVLPFINLYALPLLNVWSPRFLSTFFKEGVNFGASHSFHRSQYKDASSNVSVVLERLNLKGLSSLKVGTLTHFEGPQFKIEATTDKLELDVVLSIDLLQEKVVEDEERVQRRRIDRKRRRVQLKAHVPNSRTELMLDVRMYEFYSLLNRKLWQAKATESFRILTHTATRGSWHELLHILRPMTFALDALTVENVRVHYSRAIELDVSFLDENGRPTGAKVQPGDNATKTFLGPMLDFVFGMELFELFHSMEDNALGFTAPKLSMVVHTLLNEKLIPMIFNGPLPNRCE